MSVMRLFYHPESESYYVDDRPSEDGLSTEIGICDDIGKELLGVTKLQGAYSALARENERLNSEIKTIYGRLQASHEECEKLREAARGAIDLSGGCNCHKEYRKMQKRGFMEYDPGCLYHQCGLDELAAALASPQPAEEPPAPVAPKVCRWTTEKLLQLIDYAKQNANAGGHNCDAGIILQCFEEEWEKENPIEEVNEEAK